MDEETCESMEGGEVAAVKGTNDGEKSGADLKEFGDFGILGIWNLEGVVEEYLECMRLLDFLGAGIFNSTSGEERSSPDVADGGSSQILSKCVKATLGLNFDIFLR